jgi:hypothetical protein
MKKKKKLAEKHGGFFIGPLRNRGPSCQIKSKFLMCLAETQGCNKFEKYCAKDKSGWMLGLQHEIPNQETEIILTWWIDDIHSKM